MGNNLNIVALIDGTWNRYKTKTNVSLLEKSLFQDKAYTLKEQGRGESFITKASYAKGPGTSPGEEISGGAFAADLWKAIAYSYERIAEMLADAQREKAIPHLYLFGFSRGAYSVHVLSWLLAEHGIPKDSSKAQAIAKAYVNKSLKRLRRLTRPGDMVEAPRIKMLGLWDTVSAPLDFKKKYHNGMVSPLVDNICHALAANERRFNFRPMKYWKQDGAEVVQEWFSGAHGDVGGGYTDDMRLSDIALNWMQRHAYRNGLAFDPKVAEIATYDFKNLKIHDETLTKGAIKIKWRTFGEGETVHDSLTARMAFCDKYRPDVRGIDKVIAGLAEA